MTREQAALELICHLDAVRTMASVGILPTNEDSIYSNRLCEVLDHEHHTATEVASCATCIRISRRANNFKDPQ